MWEEAELMEQREQELKTILIKILQEIQEIIINLKQECEYMKKL